jgi:hypothetical protein
MVGVKTSIPKSERMVLVVGDEKGITSCSPTTSPATDR